MKTVRKNYRKTISTKAIIALDRSYFKVDFLKHFYRKKIANSLDIKNIDV